MFASDTGFITSVIFTTSQSQQWAHKPLVPHPPPYNSERKEFGGWLRVPAERVAAGEDRGCCWSELICSYSVCAWWWRAAASSLQDNSPGHMTGRTDSPLIRPGLPIIMLWGHCAVVWFTVILVYAVPLLWLLFTLLRNALTAVDQVLAHCRVAVVW